MSGEERPGYSGCFSLPCFTVCLADELLDFAIIFFLYLVEKEKNIKCFGISVSRYSK